MSPRDVVSLVAIREVLDRLDRLERLHPELTRYGHDEASTDAWLDALHAVEAANTDTETPPPGTDDDSENNDAS